MCRIWFQSLFAVTNEAFFFFFLFLFPAFLNFDFLCGSGEEVTSLQTRPVLRHVGLAAWNLYRNRHAGGDETW